jgi:hypothetical protein
MLGPVPVGFALPPLPEALLALGVLAVILLLRGSRPQPAALPPGLPREAAEVLAYLRARGVDGLQAPINNPVLRAAVAAGVLVEEGRLFSAQGALARYRVTEAMWRAPLAATAPAAAPPWLRVR